MRLTTGEWAFTKVGLKYYKKLRRSYVVNVPAVIHSVGDNGRTYTKKATIPISKLGIAQPEVA